MARKSDKLEALCQVRKEELIADIMRGELSWRALSSKYDVPEATLRSFADRSQIQRNPTGAKREMVAAKMALPDHSAQPALQRLLPMWAWTFSLSTLRNRRSRRYVSRSRQKLSRLV